MRRASLVLLSLCILAGAGRADSQADARAIIDKSIKASGGADKLAQFKSETFTEKGKYYGTGEALPYTGTYSVRWPDHFRMEIEGVFTLVVAGDKAWMKGDKGVVELRKEQLEREKRNLYGGYVATLLPLLDKEFTLTLLPEIKIDDKPALGVKVSKKDMPDVLLYFDKETGLLAKTEQMVEPGEGEAQKKKEVKQETFVSGYKEFAGARMPTRVVAKRDGKLYVEAEVTNAKPVEKFDEKVFSKP